MKTAASKPAKKSPPAIRATTPGNPRIRTILVPTDFSLCSLKALEYARALAGTFRASLRLINVLDVQFEIPALSALYATDTQIERKLRQRLRDIATVYAAPMRVGRCHVCFGRACDEICEHARKIHADLIVIATRGYTGLKHSLIGSTAERVVRHALCPVLVVRDKEREFVTKKNGASVSRRRTAFHLKHILVPTDFSEHSRVAVNYAIAFAKSFGAKVTLMNVIHPQYYPTNPDFSAIDYGTLLDSIHTTVRRDLNEFVRHTAFRGVPFQTHIVEGHPGDQIVNYAKKCGADLIVNATHGRTGLAHVLLGSTAEHVVRYSKCPVLIVPRAPRIGFAL